MSDTINYPKRKYRIRKLSSAIFEKESTTKEGKPFTRKTVGLQKSNKNSATDEWENQQIFLYPHEIPALITVAQKAYEYCTLDGQPEE
ncbi:MAG: hypothetical protein ABIG61_01655 [Planctomycetota bacterium]